MIPTPSASKFVKSVLDWQRRASERQLTLGGLLVLGVHPSHQGKGLARVLLEPVARMADRDGASVYLETTKESNVALYRHSASR